MRIVYKVLLMSILLAPVLLGCKSKFDEHYERPGWLKGTAYEALQDRGNYSIFLRGAERANFKNLLTGNGLCTVFAPNDEEFKKYLLANGYASIEEVDVDKLSTLIGFHIVQYSFGKVDLTNYNPAGKNSTTGSGPGGLFYKQKTFGREPFKTYSLPSGREVKVLMREKYLPILSKRFITTKSLSDYKYNFSSMYPNSEWVGTEGSGTDEGQVYAANGYVLSDGLGLPTDNGYLYLVGAVLEPLDNIHTVMEKNPQLYSTFKGLYDRFATLTYDAVLSKTYSESSSDSLYLFFHGRHGSNVTYAPAMAQIASEWTFNKEQDLPYHQGYSTGRAFNAFVPDNNTIENFIGEFFSEYTIENLPLIQTYYMVSSQILDNMPSNSTGATIGRKGIALPEEVQLGRITNAYGDVVQVDLDNSPVKQFCTNGAFYGVDKMMVPAPFKSVTKPLFQKKNLNMFLNMLYQTGGILQLTNKDVMFTLFAPTDEALTSAKIRIKDDNITILGDEKIQRQGDADFVDMSISQLNDLVDMHVVLEFIGRTAFDTKKIYPSRRSGSYIRTLDGGILGEVDYSAPIVPQYVGDYSNGIVYTVPSIIENTRKNLVAVLASDIKYDKFWKLLLKSELATPIGTSGVAWEISSIGGEDVMIFAPTNDAITADLVIAQYEADMASPDPDVALAAKMSLRNYLRSYMVSVAKSKMPNYIMIGIGSEGSYVTERIKEYAGTDPIYHKIDLSKDAANFRIKLEVYHEATSVTKTAYTLTDKFPEFATDGIVYQIATTDIQPE